MKKIISIVVIIAVGAYFLVQIFLLLDKNITVKELYEKVSSTPVSSQEVKAAFRHEMVTVCEKKGADVRNGFGTAEECLQRYETVTSEYCFRQIPDFEGKVYTSPVTLKVDSRKFFSCAIGLAWISNK